MKGSFYPQMLGSVGARLHAPMESILKDAQDGDGYPENLQILEILIQTRTLKSS